MRPLLYDFKRTLTSKPTLVSRALLVILTVGLAPFLTGSRFTGNINASGVMFHDSSGYHFMVYATNEFGQPLAGVQAQFILKSPALNYNTTGTTDTNGMMLATINAPERIDYFGAVAVETAGGNVKSLFNVPVLNASEIIPLYPVEHLFLPVTDSTNSTRRLVSLFYSAAGGSKPLSDSIYYGIFQANATDRWDLGPYGNGPVVNQTQLALLGSLNDYHQLYQLNIPSSQVCTQGSNPCDDQIYLALYSSNSTLLYSQLVPEADLYPPPALLVASDNLASQFLVSSLGVFVPLLAILGS